MNLLFAWLSLEWLGIGMFLYLDERYEWLKFNLILGLFMLITYDVYVFITA